MCSFHFFKLDDSLSLCKKTQEISMSSLGEKLHTNGQMNEDYIKEPSLWRFNKQE